MLSLAVASDAVDVDVPDRDRPPPPLDAAGGGGVRAGRGGREDANSRGERDAADPVPGTTPSGMLSAVLFRRNG